MGTRRPGLQVTGQVGAERVQVPVGSSITVEEKGTARITKDVSSYPANDYDVSGEWGRTDFDRRHRLLVLGRVTASRFFDAGISVTTNSGAPYSESVGVDMFNNGRGRARPAGVARNTLEGARYAAIDVRLSRDVKFGKEQAVTVASTRSTSSITSTTRATSAHSGRRCSADPSGQETRARRRSRYV